MGQNRLYGVNPENVWYCPVRFCPPNQRTFGAHVALILTVIYLKLYTVLILLNTIGNICETQSLVVTADKKT